MFSHYINGHFTFPPNFDFNILPSKDAPCTIISVIGDGDLYTCINKMEIFEGLTEKSMIPMNLETSYITESKFEAESSYLNGYFCESLRIVFIHLRSLNESDVLLSRYGKSKIDKLDEEKFDLEDQLHLKLIVYLSLISDFLLINIIGFDFDPYYVQLLTQANCLRKKLKNITEFELKTISTSLEVANNGRLYQAHLLFVFNPPYSPLVGKLKTDAEMLVTMRDRMEEKIHANLKYHGVIGYEVSIGRIQTHKPFVFINLPKKNPLNGIVNTFSHYSKSGFDPDALIDSEYNIQTKKFEDFIKEQIKVKKIVSESPSCLSESVNCRNWFKACHKLYNLFSEKLRLSELMSNYRQLYYSKSCEIGLSMAEAHYKEGLPNQYSRDIHCEKTKTARQVLLSISRGPLVLTTIKQLENNLNKVWAIGRQICETISMTGQRCKNEVHRVPSLNYEDDMNEGLSNQEKDLEEENDDRISNLEEGFDKLQISTTNKTKSRSQTNKTNLPIMRHNSEVQLVSACNCGRRQATRNDPFDYKEANYMFYKHMRDICCFRFRKISLPENQRVVKKKHKLSLNQQQKQKKEPTKDNKPDVEDDREDCKRSLGIAEYLSEDDEDKNDGAENDDNNYFSNNEDDEDDNSLFGDLMAPRKRNNHSSLSDDKSYNEFDDYMNEESDDSYLGNRGKNDDSDDRDDYNDEKHTENEVKLDKDVHLSIKCSDDKQLFNGMFTDLENFVMAPKWSSWSLVDSGPYFSYTHSTGLEYSGFVHGSNFLLPWDIPLQTKINVVRRQRVKKAFAAGNFLKAFIGFEMECPVGHRFFMAGPHRMMAGSMGAMQVKEAVSDLLEQSIPLYFPCQCNHYLAQLIRLFIATPHSNGLLRIFLQPRIQPGKYYNDSTNATAGGESKDSEGKEMKSVPIFSPGDVMNEPIELEPGRLWVLRFPFAFEKNGRVFKPPDTNDLSVLDDYRLLPGCVVYEEVVKEYYHSSNRRRNNSRGYGMFNRSDDDE